MLPPTHELRAVGRGEGLEDSLQPHIAVGAHRVRELAEVLGEDHRVFGANFLREHA